MLMSMVDLLDRVLPDESALVAFAQDCAPLLGGGGVVYLHGSLGAGKTTFARALLRALGVTERIKSPTYTLIEPYATPSLQAWHLDLYRIADPRELEWLGLDALADPDALVLVEWPERGADALPSADVLLRLTHAGEGRRALVSAGSARGQRILGALAGTPI